ncbi:hypothetical protein [Streptomyces sp. WAC08401]|nr:hypothetical protein [Streptomyces sp. WAC08401]
MSVDFPADLPDDIDVDADDFGANLQRIIDGYRAVALPAGEDQ